MPCANTGKQHLVGHLIDEFPLRFIADQADNRASSFDELESLNVPPVLSFEPSLESLASRSELLDAFLRLRAQTVRVSLLRLQLDRDVEIAQSVYPPVAGNYPTQRPS